ncbi:MAG: pyridoxal phosphate-dependent aminotransferase [Acidobacteriota bacterium]|jgi:aspartate aminotransferase
MNLSRRVQRLTPSPTLAVKAAAERLRAGGVDVVDFGPGEPDFDTPVAVREAAKRALDQGDTHYGGTAGKAALREAVAGDMSRRHGGDWSRDETLIGVGGKGVLFLITQSILGEGDEALILSPYWVSFPEQIRWAGAEPVVVDCRAEDGFIPGPEAVEARIGPGCRAIILNSPCNPTGAVLPRGVLEGFVDLALRHDLWLISDETYDRFVYPGVPFTSLASLRQTAPDRIVVVGSFSKTFAMTGWRVGFALGPEPLIAAMARLQGHDATHPASFVQSAAMVALQGDAGEAEAMLAEYAMRRERIVAGLGTVPGLECRAPDGAFYVFPRSGGLSRRLGCATSGELAERLIQDARVAVVPGEAFGREGFLRFSFALPAGRIDEGIRRLREIAEG